MSFRWFQLMTCVCLCVGMLACKKDSVISDSHVEDVIEWVNRQPLPVSSAETSHDAELRRKFDVAEWQEEGNELADAEAVILRLVRNGDKRLAGPVRVVRALGEVGSERSVPWLIEQLQHADWSVTRSMAAEALGKIGDDRALKPLAHVLFSDCGGPSDAAALAISKIGGNGAQEVLENRLLALERDRDWVEAALEQLRNSNNGRLEANPDQLDLKTLPTGNSEDGTGSAKGD